MKTIVPANLRVHTQRIFTVILSFLLFLVASVNAGAQTTLAQGDLSIIAFSANSPTKGITFVPWVSLETGTVIKFTDNGFHSILGSNTLNNVRWQEQVITWTATSPVAAGTAISLTGSIPSETASTGTVTFRAPDGVTSQNWALSNGGGDQIFAFQGSGGAAVANTTTFSGTLLYGIGYEAQTGINGWMLLGSISTNTSYLPVDLLLGNSMYFATGATGAQYTGPRSGFATMTAYKLAVGNILNYSTVTGGSATVTHDLTPFTLSSPAPVVTADPAGANVCAGGGTSFSVTATGATGYQWQVDGGLGWLNILDLPPYSGASTSTLTLSYTTSLMNNDRYRCIVYNGASYVNSGYGTLHTSHVVASTTQNNVACFGGSNGSATVTPANGIAPYTYLWTPAGGTGSSATGLAAGIYNVKITDAIGCIDNETVIISQPTQLVQTSSQGNVSCNGGSNGFASIIVGGGVFPYSFSWSHSANTTNTATGLAAGSYTVTATDANGCSITKTFTINQPTALTASTSQTNVSCNGGFNGSATVTPAGGNAPYSYVWLPVGGFGASATGLPAGTYSCIVTDGNGCQVTKTVTISQPAPFLLARAQVNVSCSGGSNGSATVTASGGTGSKTYQWYPSGGVSASATGLAAGVYTVVATDANGCTNTEVFTITEPLPLLATSAYTNASCSGAADGTAGVLAVGGSGSYTYSWSPSGGTHATATGLAAGNYTCTVTDANGCSLVKSFTISQATSITATSVQTNVTCYNGSNGAATVTPSGGIAPYTYSWSPAGGTAASATGLSAGTYNVTITGAFGCTYVKTITITEPSPIVASASATTQSFCSGNATNITLSSADPSVTFSWTVHNVSGSVTGATAGSGYSIAQTLNGKGIVEYMVTPAKDGCTGDPIVINVVVKGLTTLTSQPVDVQAEEGETIQFNVNATNWTLFQWQVDRGAGFESLADNSQYENVNTWQMTIHDVTADMNGYQYRCIAYGNCTAGVTSNPATLTVATKIVQTISFPAMDAVEYGTPDFDAGATSTSGLAIQYSSSDESIVSIVNGKIHIKKAGNVTITASQPGDATYKAATPVQRQLAVTPKALTLQLNADPSISKEYDGNTNATLGASNYSLTGIVGGDVVSVSGTAAYDNSQAGENKTITVGSFVLAGADKDNYTISTSTATTTGAIKRKALVVTVSSSVYITKTYDGTTTAVLSPAALQLAGAGSADISVAATADFDNKNAGNDKTITIHSFVLAGADKDNYEISTPDLTIYGDITRRAITVDLAAGLLIEKEYDGSADATISGSNLSPQVVVTGDDLLVTAVAEYDNKNAGDNKVVTVTGFVLAGEDKDNYTVENTTVVTTGSISRKVLTAIANDLSVITKVYDGNTDAEIPAGAYELGGVIGADKVTLNNPTSGYYDTKHGGENKLVTVIGLEISGDDVNNYVLDAQNILPTRGTITRKQVMLSAGTATKVYGQPDPVFSYTVETLVEGDVLPGALGREAGKDVGVYAITLGSIDGGSDYEIVTFVQERLEITPASLEIVAHAKWKNCGTMNPVFTFDFIGLVGSNPALELEVMPQASTTAGQMSPIGEYPINAWGAVSKNYNITYESSKLTVIPADNSDFEVKVWSSSPGVLQFRIYTRTAQNASIILYNRIGQEVIVNRKGLAAGINSFSIPVEQLAAGPYVVGVGAGKFRTGQKIMIR
ncbi:MAG: hypothetical protein EOO09_17020 [Chitinophagaceae bacterium]|nr:MAG: hypothetical protein EOO09_17020 [Chitinophagaceae bacterium]